MALEVIVLAAGKGTRMHSQIPKVLHKLAGKPLLFHALQTAYELNPVKIHLVLGHQSQVIAQALNELDESIRSKIVIELQTEQLGTAHAVMQALPNLENGNQVVLLYGDTPLTPRCELERLLSALLTNDMALMTAHMDNPYGYGRIIRNDEGKVLGIVEEKDCNSKQKLLTEVNTGMIATTTDILKKYILQIKNDNAQGEYYLTDLLAQLVNANLDVCCVESKMVEFLYGVNDKAQLAVVERLYQREKAQSYMKAGLTLADPERFDVRGELTFGQDCFIDTNVIILGNVHLGNNVTIGSGCILKNVTIGDRSEISPYTIMENSELKVHTTIGPFARLRPGNVLEDEVHVGNFVEVKNSHIRVGTKAGHLSYIGDTDIGTNTNIGAGTITCNYDGANKHRTTIGNDVFIGSDTQLVAPVTVEDGATVGAGATVTRTVAAKSLFVTRAQPRVLAEYKRPTKNKK